MENRAWKKHNRITKVERSVANVVPQKTNAGILKTI